MAISQEQIDAMIDTCIESIASGKELNLLKLDQLGYLDLLSEIAEHKGMKIGGTISSAASVLEASTALGVISKNAHVGFIKRHELLLYIDSSLSALAHTNPNVYASLRKTWFEKSFAEKEAVLESLPRGHNMKAEFIMHMENLQNAKAALATEKNRAKKIALEKRIAGIRNKISKLHSELASVFRQQVVREVTRLSPEVAIRRLKAVGHGRAGHTLRKYAEELARWASEAKLPQMPKKAKAMKRASPRRKGMRRPGR